MQSLSYISTLKEASYTSSFTWHVNLVPSLVLIENGFLFNSKMIDFPEADACWFVEIREVGYHVTNRTFEIKFKLGGRGEQIENRGKDKFVCSLTIDGGIPIHTSCLSKAEFSRQFCIPKQKNSLDLILTCGLKRLEVDTQIFGQENLSESNVSNNEFDQLEGSEAFDDSAQDKCQTTLDTTKEMSLLNKTIKAPEILIEGEPIVDKLCADEESSRQELVVSPVSDEGEHSVDENDEEIEGGFVSLQKPDELDHSFAESEEIEVAYERKFLPKKVTTDHTQQADEDAETDSNASLIGSNTSLINSNGSLIGSNDESALVDSDSEVDFTADEEEVIVKGLVTNHAQLAKRIRNIYLTKMIQVADTSAKMMVVAARMNFAGILSDSCKSLAAQVTLKNFPDVWNIAVELKSDELKALVIEFVKENNKLISYASNIPAELMMEMIRKKE